MKSQPDLNKIYAVIRVTIRPYDDEASFSVAVEALKCPNNFLLISPGQGKIPKYLFDAFENSFPKNLPTSIVQPEPAVSKDAEPSIKEHAAHLEKVFWGGDVWKESDRWKVWWKDLIQHLKRSGGLTIIELVLCREMRRFVWESLLLLDDFFSPSECAIVRTRYEDTKSADSLQIRSPVTWMAVLSNPYRNTGDPQDITLLENKVTPYIEHKKKQSADAIVEVEATALKGQLDVIKEKAREKQITSFLYVGHGLIDRSQCQLELEAAGGSLSSVKTGPKQLKEAFKPGFPPILILIACSLACIDNASNVDESKLSSRQPIDDLIDESSIIVAMQFQFSIEAAGVFIKEFLAGEDLSSVQGIARGVMRGRGGLFSSGTGKFDKIETITPVIYSRVSVVPAPPIVRSRPKLLIGIVVLFLIVIGIIIRSSSQAGGVSTPVATPTLTPILTTPTPTLALVPPFILEPCVELDVNTFTLDDGVSTKTITANTTYSTTLVKGKLPQLIITANVTARPSGCQQQLTYQWTRYNSTGSLALSNFQDFHIIDQPSPPMGQVEMIRVFVEDKVTHAQVSTYLNLSSISPEESKGATP